MLNAPRQLEGAGDLQVLALEPQRPARLARETSRRGVRTTATAGCARAAAVDVGARDDRSYNSYTVVDTGQFQCQQRAAHGVADGRACWFPLRAPAARPAGTSPSGGFVADLRGSFMRRSASSRRPGTAPAWLPARTRRRRWGCRRRRGRARTTRSAGASSPSASAPPTMPPVRRPQRAETRTFVDPDGPHAAQDVYRAVSPQLSLNFGGRDGWSYLSGGLGTSRLALLRAADGGDPQPDQRSRPHPELRRRRALVSSSGEAGVLARPALSTPSVPLAPTAAEHPQIAAHDAHGAERRRLVQVAGAAQRPAGPLRP